MMWREAVFDAILASAVVSNHVMREMGRAWNLTSLLTEQ